MSTRAWSDSEIAVLDEAVEISLAPRRRDGTLRRPTTIWIVTIGDEAFIRSQNGTDGSWYRSAVGGRPGRLQAGRLTTDVSFAPVERADDLDAVTAAYLQKYGRFEKIYGQPIITPQSVVATLRVMPVSAAPGK